MGGAAGGALWSAGATSCEVLFEPSTLAFFFFFGFGVGCEVALGAGVRFSLVLPRLEPFALGCFRSRPELFDF